MWFLIAEHRLSRHMDFRSCGLQAWLLHGMWDLPELGIKPMSPALASGFLTIGPRPLDSFFEKQFILYWGIAD